MFCCLLAEAAWCVYDLGLIESVRSMSETSETSQLVWIKRSVCLKRLTDTFMNVENEIDSADC